MNCSAQEFVRKFFYKLPLFKKMYKSLATDLDQDKLETIVKRAIADVPFYYNYRNLITVPFNLKSFPIIRKSDIIGIEKTFVSRRCSSLFMSKKETGGSTGKSLELFYSLSTIIKKETLPYYAFSLIGSNLRIAVLRGKVPCGGNIMEKINDSYILLSSYQLSENTIRKYVDIINQYKIECLHVYPSSFMIFLRLYSLYCKDCELTYLRGIVSSSETFTREDKYAVKNMFPHIKIIDLYGHNELACGAISVDLEPYKFFSSYGYVEFLKTGDRTCEDNSIAEIIATSIMNKDMPFIRYATEDYVELDSKGRVVAIIGRSSDFIVNNRGKIIPCMAPTRACSMVHVQTFQYFQDTVGRIEFRISVTKGYNKKEENFLLEDLQGAFKDVQCVVKIVNENDIIRTKRGKQLRLVQKLDLAQYIY